MKIVIAAEIFPPDIGGPATYSEKLAKELTGQGWQIKVICYSTKIKDNDYPFFVKLILRGQSTLRRYFQYFWNLLKIAKSCDVIYAQGPISSGLPAIIVGFLLRKRVVVKVVGDYAWEQAQNFGKTNLLIDEFQNIRPKGKIGWFKKIEKLVCRKTNKIIVPSQYLKNIVRGWGIREDKIKIIYNAINLGHSTQYKSPQGQIVSIGRLVAWKGFETLISLIPELLKEIPNLKLKIYGDGPYKDKLKKLISNLNLENKVFIEKLDHNQLLLKLTNTEIFVLNSAYEGFPHTVLEAMSVGTPVITTNICGNPEVVENEYNGLLVEYNNKDQLKKAILKLYNNSELRQKFVKNSYEVLKKFSFQEMIEKTIKVLKNNNS